MFLLFGEHLGHVDVLMLMIGIVWTNAQAMLQAVCVDLVKSIVVLYTKVLSTLIRLLGGHYP